jgi:hypothetical protein
MNNREISAYAIVVLVLFVVLPTIYYDMGYRARGEESSEKPNSLMVTTSILTLNATTYNMSWYDKGFGDLEQLPEPTLCNNSFVIYVYARWGESGLYMGHNGQMPHANITVVVLPMEPGPYNLTIERVVLYKYDLMEWQTDSYYDNEKVRIESVDYVGIALFGYGSHHSDIVFWSTRNILFIVSSVWYEEVIPVEIPTV